MTTIVDEKEVGSIYQVKSPHGLIISELYNKPTVQGEGPHLGTPCTFMRLGGCNLQCGVGWENDSYIWRCDSAYTWDWTGVAGKRFDPRVELTKRPYEDIIAWLKGFSDTTRVRTLIITGGEPLLQDRGIAELMRELWTPPNSTWWSKWQVHVETNGTIQPVDSDKYINFYCVSPKLANSGNAMIKRFNASALVWFARRQAAFKFVVSSVDDLAEVDDIVVSIGIPATQVYIMAAGTDNDTLTGVQAAVVDEVIGRGYNLTTRLHIQLFGNTRGT